VINSPRNSSFYNTAIDPKCDHTLYGVLITKKTNPIYTFALSSIGLHSISSSSPSMAPSHHDQHASCHNLGVYQSPFAINTQAHVISTYVSSISQNQTSDFHPSTFSFSLISLHLEPIFLSILFPTPDLYWQRDRDQAGYWGRKR
jgi:hypothetical protein